MSQYFHNRTLLSPGFTGSDGNTLQLLQNRSWVGFDGAPVLTAITGEFNFGLNSAGGAQIFSDVSGIVYRTTGILNYAYNVKFSDNKNLRLGIGFSISSERLNFAALDPNAAIDPLIAANINGKPSFDGNFGAVYTNKKLTLSTSFFRIAENLAENKLGQADLIIMKAGAFYHINQDKTDKVQIRPLMMLSVFRNVPIVFDLGTQVILNKFVNAMAVYQSTGNLRFGAGLVVNKIGEANLFYNYSITKASTYAQQFEIGLKFNLKN